MKIKIVGDRSKVFAGTPYDAKHREARNAEQDDYEALSAKQRKLTADLPSVKSAPMIRRWLNGNRAPVTRTTPREHRPSSPTSNANEERGPPRRDDDDPDVGLLLRYEEQQLPYYGDERAVRCSYCSHISPSEYHLQQHVAYRCTGMWMRWSA